MSQVMEKKKRAKLLNEILELVIQVGRNTEAIQWVMVNKQCMTRISL